MKIGLTGGIGSGKSEVARLLAERGALIIDADEIARGLVQPGQPALAEIVAAFGEQVLLPDGGMDRAAVAELVFNNEDARARLNAIIHPRVAEETARRLGEAPDGAVVVYDIPLLIETGAIDGWDHIIAVLAPEGERIERLRQSRGMSDADIRDRMATQVDDHARRQTADIIIDNDGSLQELVDDVDIIWTALTLEAR